MNISVIMRGCRPDVHLTKAGMTCTKYHGEELHGSGQDVDSRYQNPDLVKCEDCHEDVWTNTEGNPQHEQHLSDLSCQVCHRQPLTALMILSYQTDKLGAELKEIIS